MTWKASPKFSSTPTDYLAAWQLPLPNGGTFDAHDALTVEAGMPPTGSAHGNFEVGLKQLAGGGLELAPSVDSPVAAGVRQKILRWSHNGCYVCEKGRRNHFSTVDFDRDRANNKDGI